MAGTIGNFVAGRREGVGVAQIARLAGSGVAKAHLAIGKQDVMKGDEEARAVAAIVERLTIEAHVLHREPAP